MATLDFVPIATGVRTASAALVLHASATIASKTVYTAISNDANCYGWEAVVFDIVYTKGDETSLRGYVEFYNGTAWIPAGLKGAQSGGYSPLGIDYFELIGTQTVSTPPIDVVTKQKIRLTVVANGGTPTGTIAVSATAGIGVKARGA